MKKFLLLLGFLVIALSASAQDIMTILGEKVQVFLLATDGTWVENPVEDLESIIVLDGDESTITITADGMNFAYFITESEEPVFDDNSVVWRMSFIDPNEDTGNILMYIDSSDSSAAFQVEYADTMLTFYGYLQ